MEDSESGDPHCLLAESTACLTHMYSSNFRLKTVTTILQELALNFYHAPFWSQASSHWTWWQAPFYLNVTSPAFSPAPKELNFSTSTFLTLWAR